MSEETVIVLLLGPSGTGKSTEEKKLEESGQYLREISFTSRAPRTHEQHGREYYFTTRQGMLDMSERGELVEYTSYPPHGEICRDVTCTHCNLYGSGREEVLSKLAQGDLLIVAEGRGVQQFLEAFPTRSIVVYLQPPVDIYGKPRFDILAERLRWRGESEETIAKRLDGEHVLDEMGYGQRLAHVIIDSGKSLDTVHTDVQWALNFVREKGPAWRAVNRLNMVGRILEEGRPIRRALADMMAAVDAGEAKITNWVVKPSSGVQADAALEA